MSYFNATDGCRLYYEFHGSDHHKPVLVFLNGTTQTTVHWRAQALYFKNQFRVLLYDARAQGQSDLGPRPLSLDLHVADLQALLDHLNIAGAHLVGISHGAQIALALAAQERHRIQRLLLCSLGAESTARARAMVRSWMEILKDCGPAAMAWAILPAILGERYLEQHRRILDKLVDAIAKRNRKDYLLAHLEAIQRYPQPALHAVDISQPCLIIVGAQDPLVSLKETKRLADLCRGTREIIPDTGHSVPLEIPELFNQMAAHFFILI